MKRRILKQTKLLWHCAVQLSTVVMGPAYEECPPPHWCLSGINDPRQSSRSSASFSLSYFPQQRPAGDRFYTRNTRQCRAARQGNISNYVWGSLEKITQLSSFYVCVYVNTDCQCPSLLPLPTVSQHNNKVTQLRLAPIIIYTNIYILHI